MVSTSMHPLKWIQLEPLLFRSKIYSTCTNLVMYNMLVEYVESENLKDVDDVNLTLQTLLADLDSEDSLIVCEALNNVRRLSVHHKEAMRDMLGNMILPVVKSLQNPENAVCKTAVMSSSDIFKAYGDGIIDSMDPLLVELLLKASQDDRFVSEAAERALRTMLGSVSPTVLLAKLEPHLDHTNPGIRAKAWTYYSCSLSGGGDMGCFTLEVMIQIFSLLPVKSLIRFRVVESWKQVIDSEYFIKEHLIKTKARGNHKRLILQGSNSDLFSLDLNSILSTNTAELVRVRKPFGEVSLVGCCDGIVCVSTPQGEPVALWNLSTGRHHFLPRLRKRFRNRRGFCGFGYDVGGKDYKVVYASISKHPAARVYSLKSRSWKKIEDFPYAFSDYFPVGTLACGGLHTIVRMPTSLDWSICALDLATEDYKIVKKPVDDTNIVQASALLGTVKECLSLAYHKSFTDHTDLWVLRDYADELSWTVIARITPSVGGRIIGSLGKNELLLFHYRNDTATMSIYNVENNMDRNVEIDGIEALAVGRIYIYNESLLQFGDAGTDLCSWEEQFESEKEMLDRGDEGHSNSKVRKLN